MNFTEYSVFSFQLKTVILKENKTDMDKIKIGLLGLSMFLQVSFLA